MSRVCSWQLYGLFNLITTQPLHAPSSICHLWVFLLLVIPALDLTWVVSRCLTLPSVMYLQLILRNFSVRASSSSEVDDTTLDWRRAENTGGWTPSGLGGASESWREDRRRCGDKNNHCVLDCLLPSDFHLKLRQVFPVGCSNIKKRHNETQDKCSLFHLILFCEKLNSFQPYRQLRTNEHWRVGTARFAW